MKEKLKFNIVNYLKTNSRNQIIIMFIVLLLFIVLIFISSIFSIYTIDTINVQTICDKDECLLKFFKTNLNNDKYVFAKIRKKEYKIKNYVLGEASIDEDNNIIQEVSMTLKGYQGINNEIIEINLYKNKDRIIKKIAKIIVER